MTLSSFSCSIQRYGHSSCRICWRSLCWSGGGCGEETSLLLLRHSLRKDREDSWFTFLDPILSPHPPTGLFRKNILSHELMSVSPVGSTSPGYIAIGGRSGYVHILSSRTKTWVTDVKMSSDEHLTALCWWDENILCGAAGGGNICLWDIRMTGGGGRVLSRSVPAIFSSSLLLSSQLPPR